MQSPKAELRKTPVGKIAAAMPFAAGIFRKFGVDYCCRGDLLLDEACREEGLDEDLIADELLRMAEAHPETNWSSLSDGDLIQHLLDRHHLRLRETMPGIVELARKVELVHADHLACPRGLSTELASAWSDLEAHLQREENVVFPHLESEAGHPSQPLLREMMEEHRNQGLALERLRSICHGYVAPKDACRSWQALYAALLRFEQELMEHIHLENNILFERALRQVSGG